VITDYPVNGSKKNDDQRDYDVESVQSAVVNFRGYPVFYKLNSPGQSVVVEGEEPVS